MLNGADPENLTRRVREMLDAGRVGVARPLLAALRRLQPGAPGLADMEARLLLHEGRPDAALAGLDRALLDNPDDAALRKRRAKARLELGNVAGAASDVAEAVLLDPHDVEGKAMLGVLLVELGQIADGAACLAEALAEQPGVAAHYRGLAEAQQAGGAADQAAATLSAGIAACPLDRALRNAAVLLALRQHDFAGAVELAGAARNDGAADAWLFARLGDALCGLGRHEAAAEAYAEAGKLAPADAAIRQLLLTASLRPEDAGVPAPVLRALYDMRAETYDREQIGQGYRVPGLVRAAVQRLSEGMGQGVLDLGCGTGLVGVTLGDLPLGPVTGVDLSPAMLDQARRKQLYAGLHEAEFLDFLSADARQWPIIVAADSLVHQGALDEVFAALHARLAPAGMLVLSLQAPLRVKLVPAGNGDWVLERHGRYAHERVYIERLASRLGYAIHTLEPQVLRHDRQGPVAGWTVVLERR